MKAMIGQARFEPCSRCGVGQVLVFSKPLRRERTTVNSLLASLFNSLEDMLPETKDDDGYSVLICWAQKWLTETVNYTFFRRERERCGSVGGSRSCTLIRPTCEMIV